MLQAIDERKVGWFRESFKGVARVPFRLSMNPTGRVTGSILEDLHMWLVIVFDILFSFLLYH